MKNADHYDALQLDLATLYSNTFFSLVQPVNCEISFIWIGVLRRQDGRSNCLLDLDNAFA